MMPKLSPAGRTALWTGCGGFLGLAVGALLVNPGRAGAFALPWAALFVLYLAAVLAFGRARPVKSQAVHVQRVAIGASQGLQLHVALPDVPEGFPPVMGRAEPLRVRVSVAKGAAQAAGAAVRLKAIMGGETLSGDGVAGTDGSVEFTLEPAGVGELALRAEAVLDGTRGEASASASIVQYEDEITRLFGEFRAFATSVLGPDAHADTARELAERLRPKAGPESARALLELARIYELVAYGEREADRSLYLAVMEQLLVLERIDVPAEAPAAAPRGA